MVRGTDNSLYCGVAVDLEKRIAAHNTSRGSKYLRGKLPVSLVHLEKHADRSAALKREIEVKKWPKGKKERLVSNGY